MAEVNDVKIFVPAKDFERSLNFYQALGWTLTWKADDNSLAELELAGHRFYLQDYYVKDWAWNFMIHVAVDDVAFWEAKSRKVADEFGLKHKPTHDQGYADVAHVWDPCGVLIHFAQLKN